MADIAKMKEITGRLHRLLEDAHPGLGMWHQSVGRVYQELKKEMEPTPLFTKEDIEVLRMARIEEEYEAVTDWDEMLKLEDIIRRVETLTN